MKKQTNSSIKAQLLGSALILLSLLAICAIPFALAQSRNRGSVKPNATNPATQSIPFATAGLWETVHDFANRGQKVATPFLVFTVTNTNDIGPGSLRQAIFDSNVNPPPPPGTTNLITFNISGTGVHTIMPGTQLPDIIQPVMIDGYTQPGSSPNTNPPGIRDNAIILIELSGAIATPGSSGLIIRANQCGVRGLVINQFQGDAIDIGPSKNDNVIEGNFIGTNATGTAALPNGSFGNGGVILLSGSNNRIGGTAPAARNLISGNTGDGVVVQGSNSLVQGNIIGTDVTGSVPIGNTQRGVSSNGGTLIGGNTAAARNIISGNSRGIDVASSDVVQGNFIGTDLTGTIAVPNLNIGVLSGGATIGGLTSAPGTPPGNLISGNGIAGLVIFASSILKGNIIGADITGTHALANAAGISIVGALNSTVGGTEAGARNIVAFNGSLCDVFAAGVIVSGSNAIGNAILGNSIFSNGGLGIDLTVPFDGPCGITANDNCDTDIGPNNLQNYPILTSATSGGGRTAIQGSLNSAPNTAFSIEFFDNHQCHPSGNGSGETFIGSTNVTTDGNCAAPFSVTLGVNVQPGHVVTATATDSAGNTSEFSRCVPVIAGIPSPTPTGTPSPTPTGTPSATPTGTPSATPTGTPSATPTGTPSSTPTGTPTSTPGCPTPTGTPSASPSGTPSPSCTPNSTPTPGACTTYEAESCNNTLTGSAFVLNCPTCSGGQRVGFVGNNSGTLQFNILNVVPGRQTVTISYTNGDPVRYALLSVNGNQGMPLTFPSTGSFQTVGSIQVTVVLNTGSNTLEFYNPIVGSWAPDFDQIQFNCPTSYLGNISTRSFVQTGDNVMIGGFIVQGTHSKRVILRAIGPELSQYGVPDLMCDPTLELHDGNGAVIARNDDWQHTIIGGIITENQVQAIQDSGHAPTDPRESAIVADLPPGRYTAIVRGVNNTTGVALVEAYDLSPSLHSILGNISTRSFVQTGNDVMIGGFIVQGTQPKNVIIRAIGPELSQYGVPDFLVNPTLELHNGNGAVIARNDDWQHTIIGGIITENQVQAIQNSGHAPTDPSESAIIANLRPGNYTAIVRGVNGTIGVALVEVYDLH